jgi:hypothetical protein
VALGARAGPLAHAALCRSAANRQAGDQAEFSLSHGAVQLAAEQALSDIGTVETERQAKR